MNLKDAIRQVNNFPKEGILFYDITTLLKSADYLNLAIDKMAEKIQNIDFDLVVCPESRGFIFGMPLAYKLKKGFVPARKPGKLPYKKVSKTYDLEYGSNSIELHADAIKPNQKVIIVDDLLATGGTCKTLAELIEDMGGKVAGIEFLIELKNLGGRNFLSNYKNVLSVIEY
jgi:adenine phosphoribosyltransferase